MSSFSADVLPALLVVSLLSSGGPAERPLARADSRADSLAVRLRHLESLERAEMRAGMEGEGKLEERDGWLRVATEASRLAEDLDRSNRDSDHPDSLSSRAAIVALKARARALGLHAALLDAASRSIATGMPAAGMPSVGPASFAALWEGAISDLVAYMERWPALWRENLVVGDAEIYLPFHLLALSACDTYSGDDYVLPRAALDRRMGEFADSLARCCLQERRCREVSGGDCPAYVASVLARCIDLDALLGFRFGAMYWALPPGRPVRTPSADRFIASATIGLLSEIKAAATLAAFGAPLDGRDAEAAALQALRSGQGLWPPDLDPFRSVPGIRNPRPGREGRLKCDLAIYRGCYEAADPKAAEWLRGMLGEGEEIVLIDLP